MGVVTPETHMHAPETKSDVDAELASLFCAHADHIVRYLRSSFPAMCPSRAEDAAYEAYIVALKRPDLFADALARGGPQRALALFRRIAWRNLRGQWRRKAFQRETTQLDASAYGGPNHPGQDLLVRFDERLEDVLHDAVNRFGGTRKTALRAALEAKFTGGGSDKDIAESHGFPREYLNRAKQHVLREMVPA